MEKQFIEENLGSLGENLFLPTQKKTYISNYQKPMSNSNDKFIYVIDHWINGLIVLIAENDMKALSLITADSDLKFDQQYSDKLIGNITGSTKIKLADDYKCGIIDAFITQ